MSEPSFPKFNLFPTELRLAVWNYYALPRTPLLWSVSYRGSVGELLFCPFGLKGRTINPLMLPTMRALMKVNREAREAVLAGRELQRVKQGGYRVTTFLNMVVNQSAMRRRQIEMHNFFFVNWDIDVFYFRRGLHLDVGQFLDSSCLLKVKRIAIDIKTPWLELGEPEGSRLHVPPHAWLFYGTSIQNVERLPALRSIHLVLDCHAIRRLYAYTKILGGVKSDGEENIKTYDPHHNEGSENNGLGTFFGGSYMEMEYGEFDHSDSSFDRENEENYWQWLAKLRAVCPEYGFENIELDPYQ
ncbi:hypothetical protein F5Y01DRAFT_327337 [Xylaria sp. FL0043]|nr:hypothetical protein F5Y01DRAFT_327337 [Xylaria sp. FL0043]